MSDNKLYIDAIGVASPGLEGWENSKSVISNQQKLSPQPLQKYKPELLPPNERRRTTELVKLAFRCSEDACSNLDIDLSTIATVFASSGGDYNIIDSICRTMKGEDRSVSPTQFHNSVHNSAAGYWSIATKSQACSTSLSAFDWTFSSGLLEAAGLVAVEKKLTLFTCYDISPPQPLYFERPVDIPFAISLLLRPQKSINTLASITLDINDQKKIETPCDNQELENIRQNNPAAKGLPLLELIASQKNGTCYINTHRGRNITMEVKIANQ